MPTSWQEVSRRIEDLMIAIGTAKTISPITRVRKATETQLQKTGVKTLGAEPFQGFHLAIRLSFAEAAE